MILYIVFLHALFGLIVGSFLNVVILRSFTSRSVLGRSGCLSCKKTLEVQDLIPLFSWARMGGRCRHCGSRVSMQYPLVELSTALLFAGIGYADPYVFLAPSFALITHLLMLVLVALFVIIAAYDIRHTIIPDTWVYTSAIVSLAVGVFSLPYLHSEFAVRDALQVLIDGFIVALPLFLLWLFSRGRAMGFGDVKLALSIGFLLGWQDGVVALGLSFILGAIISVFVVMVYPHMQLRLAHRGITRLGSAVKVGTIKYEVPFGPFLIAGCLIVWFSLMLGFAIPYSPF